MREPLFDLLAVVGAGLAGAVITAAAIALWHRHEIARIAASHRALRASWRRLGEVWEQLDPDRRMTLPAHTRLAIGAAVFFNSITSIFDRRHS